MIILHDINPLDDAKLSPCSPRKLILRMASRGYYNARVCIEKDSVPTIVGEFVSVPIPKMPEFNEPLCDWLITHRIKLNENRARFIVFHN
jgi:hypothetical protein